MRGEKRKPTLHLGAHLHVRNRYRCAPPDFYALAAQYPSFRKYVRNVDDAKRTATLVWDDPRAARELTKTLLLHDFQLHWTMPLDRLCPPLPNRLNYIHWIEDLLLQAGVDPFASTINTPTTVSDCALPPPPPPAIRGLDIGTGASCIFPLLGARLNNWAFVATEIDAASLASARANVERNALAHQIDVRRVTSQRLLLEPLTAPELLSLLAPPALPPGTGTTAFHFSMCNPPFFDAASEADTNPQTCCRGSASEMVCPGGEVAFITHMIDDSVVLRARVLWYTSMIGRKRSIRQVLAVLRDRRVPHTRTTEFCQGRTKRWGVAWSFATDVLELEPATAASHKVLGKRKEAHRRNELVFMVPYASSERFGCASLHEVAVRVREFAAADRTIKIDGEDDSEGGDDSEDDEDGDGAGARTSGTMGHGDDEDASENTYAFFRLRSARDSSESFQARVEVTERSELSAEQGFDVSITYEAGARSAFWRAADALKAATVRSGRQWRRRKQSQFSDDGERAGTSTTTSPRISPDAGC